MVVGKPFLCQEGWKLMDVDCICISSQVSSPRKMREDIIYLSIDWTVTIKVVADVCNSLFPPFLNFVLTHDLLPVKNEVEWITMAWGIMLTDNWLDSDFLVVNQFTKCLYDAFWWHCKFGHLACIFGCWWELRIELFDPHEFWRACSTIWRECKGDECCDTECIGWEELLKVRRNFVWHCKLCWKVTKHLQKKLSKFENLIFLWMV